MKKWDTILHFDEWLALPEEKKRERLTPQCRRVLEFVDMNGSINPMQALTEIGVMRLAARIDDLEWMGWHFDHTPTKGVNRYGEKTRYMTYSYKKVA